MNADNRSAAGAGAIRRITTMFESWTRRNDSTQGQVLVIVAGGMIALIAMVGLVIDGGYAWGQQRETQNGADSASKAGTVVIQGYLSDPAGGATDGDVGCAVASSAAANEIEIDTVIYVDYVGTPFSPEVPVAACGGGGTIPAGAQGVKANAMQEFETFLMGIIGFSDLTARADATAVVGVQTAVCPADAGCAVLPVTFPHRAVVCDGTNDQVIIGEGDWTILVQPTDTLTQSNLSMIPLCTTGPGSVGWLDFGCDPNLAGMIDDPCNIEIPIPAWLETKTGNVNSLEDNLAAYHGDQVGVPEEEDIVVQVPIHNNTCETDVDGEDNDPALYSAVCPDGDWSGQGAQLAYHVPYWQGFKLDAAYTGGNDPECGELPGEPQMADGGNGATGCFKGWFVSRTGAPSSISTGIINPGDPVPMGVILVN